MPYTNIDNIMEFKTNNEKLSVISIAGIPLLTIILSINTCSYFDVEMNNFSIS